LGHGRHAGVELRSKRAEQRRITHFSKCSATLVNQASLLLFVRQVQCYKDYLAAIPLD
jgi:hypothetical protein